jgi:hypothetical protein
LNLIDVVQEDVMTVSDNSQQIEGERAAVLSGPTLKGTRSIWC